MGSFIGSINPDELALLVSLFALALADGLTPDEKVSLGTFIAAVGDTVTLIGTQESLIRGPSDGNGHCGGN